MIQGGDEYASVKASLLRLSSFIGILQAAQIRRTSLLQTIVVESAGLSSMLLDEDVERLSGRYKNTAKLGKLSILYVTKKQ